MLRFFFLLIFSFFSFYAQAIELIYPIILKDLNTINIQDYLVSEKLDGIRAYWDGKQLLSKSGKNLNPPQWFIKNFPPFALDGELFTKQGDFENIVSIIKNQQDKEQWKNITYHIFEVPNQQGNLIERLQVLENFLKQNQSLPIKIIPQYQFIQLESLKHFIKEIQNSNGEGVILRNKLSSYETGRKPSALKYKFFLDSECEIIDYKKGKGKYANQVGSIICKEGDKIFKIGSGLSEDFRKNPPKIGTIITYKFYKTTKNNLPRHPVFLRLYRDF